MLAVSLLRLARHSLRDAGLMVLVLAALAVGLFLCAGPLAAIGAWNLLVFFVLLVGAAVLLGVPIAFAFGLATVAYLLTVTTTPVSVVVGRLDEGMSSLILLAVPLFVLLGQLVEMTGMARAMVGFLAALIGHVRGGLSYVLLGGMLLVSGISGSKAADMAAVAPVLFPEMKRRGLNEGEMVSLLAASGAMAETIPPSLVLIAIASVTGVSIAALFTGGLLPGLVMALALAVIAPAPHRCPGGTARGAGAGPGGGARLRHRPAGAGAAGADPHRRGAGRGDRDRGLHHRDRLRHRRRAAGVPAVRLAADRPDAGRDGVPVRGPSCSSSERRRRWPGRWTQSGFSQSLAHAMGSVPGGRYGFMLISIVAFIVLGSVLEGIPAMVLFGPLLFPIVRQIGINEVHYAIIIILAMGIGLFAPPFGLGYYTACLIGRVHPDVALTRIWPYLGALLVSLLLLAAVPWFATGFLP